MPLGVQYPSGASFLVLFLHFTNTAGTILTALLSGARAIGRGALCSHPGAELGTDKKKNLSDTLACVQTKRMLTHTGIIEEIMQYLHLLPPGSFRVFAAVQANWPAER